MKEFEIAKKIGKDLTESELKEAAAKALGVKPEKVGAAVIVRRSVDARQDILYRYRVQAYREGETYEPYKLPDYQDVHDAEPVVVIGAGPAGLFAALKLLTRGLKPVILERGKDVHRRKADMARLSVEGVIDPDSNYCYGEGGAGAFSDGKLFTRSSKRGDIREVLHQFVRFGADPSILIDAHPHLGTDKLPAIVENIRLCIGEHGGEYHFDSRVTDIVPVDGGFEVHAGETVYKAAKVILASGHSARDIYEIFARRGWALEAKGFALGVRVEHPQWLINQIRYHGKYQPFMPTAEYSFVQQVEDRGVFSFCMCPGGILVPSSTEDGTVVLNGMSNSARNSKWANAGVVVQIEPGDQPAEYQGPFALMDYQHDIEKKMYEYVSTHGGKHPLAAPAQRMKDSSSRRTCPRRPTTRARGLRRCTSSCRSTCPCGSVAPSRRWTARCTAIIRTTPFSWAWNPAPPRRSACRGIPRRSNTWTFPACIPAGKAPVTPAASFLPPWTASIARRRYDPYQRNLDDRSCRVLQRDAAESICHAGTAGDSFRTHRQRPGRDDGRLHRRRPGAGGPHGQDPPPLQPTADGVLPVRDAG